MVRLVLPSMPELPDVVVYLEALTRHVVGQPPRAAQAPQPVRAAHRSIRRSTRSTARSCAASAASASASSSSFDDGSVSRHPPDDRRAAALARAGQEARHRAEADARVVRCSRTARCSSPRRARRSARRCSSCAARRRCARSIPAASSRSTRRVEQFHDALTRENHTLKRALTDPHLFSGIGNAYSDEILHAARLSPLKLTRSLTDEEFARLYDATRATLLAWIERLRDADRRRLSREGDGVPRRDGGARPLQAAVPGLRRAGAAHRLRRRTSATTARRCQTGGRLLADRSLSRLLKDDWPRSIDELLQLANRCITTCRFIDMKQASALYRLLGDEARLRLLRVLARERLNVTELTGVLGLAQSGVSRHLGPAEGRRARRRRARRRLHAITALAARCDGRRQRRCRRAARRAVRRVGGRSGGARRRGAAAGSAAAAQGELRHARRPRHARRAAAGARPQLGGLVARARPAAAAARRRRPRLRRRLPDDRGGALGVAGRSPSIDRTPCSTRAQGAGAAPPRVERRSGRRASSRSCRCKDAAVDVALLSQALHHAARSGARGRRSGPHHRARRPRAACSICATHDEEWVRAKLGDRGSASTTTS